MEIKKFEFYTYNITKREQFEKPVWRLCMLIGTLFVNSHLIFVWRFK